MNRHHSSRRRLSLLVAIGAAIALGTAAVAWAAPVKIPDPSNPLPLQSVGEAAFDVVQPPAYNDDCALGDRPGLPGDDRGYSPANDVRAANTNGDGFTDDDVFDGGLVLAVARGAGTPVIFEDPDSFGNKVGQQIAVGPANMLGLRVTRTERAFATHPTLRSLIKLENTKRKAVRRKLIWDSDLGADGDEHVAASSTNDLALTNNDRWMIFNDSFPSDAIGTFVLYGKGKGVKRTRVLNPVVDGDSCISFAITLRIPKRATRYLLFFTQVHEHDELAAGVTDAAMFNARRPKGGLLNGLRPKIRRRIVNWDL